MSYRDQYLVPMNESIILQIILKRRLITEDLTNTHDRRFGRAKLPYILTGNVSGKVNTRMVRNSKLLAKIEEDSDYQYLVNYKYKELEELQPGTIKGILSSFIYTKFTYVMYEAPEYTDQEIEVDEDQICHELIQYLKMI